VKSAPTIVIALALLAPLSAFAHDADIVYAQVERQAGSGEVKELITLTATSLALLAPVDADDDRELTQADLDAKTAALEAGVWDSLPLISDKAPCQRQSTAARVREGYVELSAIFRCPPGELTQTFKILSILPSNYRVILGSQVDGERGQAFAQGNVQTLILHQGQGAGLAQEKISGFFGWVQLGVVHIFGGFDHLAFLIALLLVGGTWRRTLLMVTAFTLAHSITLGATALELIVLSPSLQRWVEAAIAFSIIWVAAENLVLKQHRHRAAITYAFGLVHGFGFASVLQSYGLGDQVVSGLLGFNLGVELGQACVVLALFPVVTMLGRRPQAATWTVRVCSLLILAAGGYWLVDRVLG
jgi:hypothetical protein